MSTHLNSDITNVPPQTNEDVNKKQDRNVSKKLTSFGTYTNGKDSKKSGYLLTSRRYHQQMYIHIFLLYGIDSSRDMSTHLNSDITNVPPQTNEDVNKKQDRNVSKKLTSFGTYTNGKDSKSIAVDFFGVFFQIFAVAEYVVDVSE
ncbi:hypothetical protein DdX_11837 [Ditylenchus destructor]|uniref:Uncharacterized protein n=1 Tax=Ditylenchus destructor TaxID=166010 RepID=A0AAD4MW61_9BILA|nr:hypothetical protein DdX_11837 [Ditylenchus destructor]